jgi:hypothetical protein
MATTTTRLNPYRSPREWFEFRIGGVLVPGVVSDVDGWDKPEKWLVQMGIQVSNAFTIWRGTQIAEEITITTELPNEKSVDDYWALRDKLRPKIGSKPPVFPITNAAFSFAGITRVSIKRILPPKRVPGLSWQGKIILIEFNPQKFAKIGPADPPKEKSENDRLADEFARTVQEAKTKGFL